MRDGRYYVRQRKLEEMHRLLRMLRVWCVVIVPPICMTGCCSANVMVNNIGLREKWGESDKTMKGDVVLVPIKESKMEVSVCVVAVPERAEDGKALGVYSFDVKDIRKDARSGTQYCFGRVNINVDGVTTSFDVDWWNDSDVSYRISHRYRKWYWYPAQTLRVIAIPVDVVTGVFWVTAYGVSCLFQ